MRPLSRLLLVLAVLGLTLLTSTASAATAGSTAAAATAKSTAAAKAKAKACRVATRARSQCRRTLRAHRGPAPVRIVTPLAGATVAGSLADGECAVQVARPRSARHVEFLVDGRRLNRAERAPYRCSHFARQDTVDTTRFADGTHELTARLVERDGDTYATKVAFEVDNSRPTGTAAARRKPKNTTTTTTQTTTVTEPTTTTGTTTTTAPAPAAPVDGTSVFADTFDAGSLTSWSMVQRVADDRIRVTTPPAGRTGAAARFEVRPGDHVNGEQPSRAEIGWNGDMASEGETRTYSWSSWLAPDFPSVATWQNLLQWKNEGAGSPPLQIQVNGEELRLQAGSQHGYKVFWQTPVVRGQWLDFSVRVRWSERQDSGWVEVFYGGRQVLARTPIQGLYPGLQNYLKVGLYRDEAVNTTGVVYHDDVRVASS
jgi:hypothetical protein